MGSTDELFHLRASDRTRFENARPVADALQKILGLARHYLTGRRVPAARRLDRQWPWGKPGCWPATAIPPDEHQVRIEFAYDDGGLAKGGTVTLPHNHAGSRVAGGSCRLEASHFHRHKILELLLKPDEHWYRLRRE
jgi:hypothetical protein